MKRTFTIQSGFTLVEMLVALALFTVVATIAAGTLLVLIGGNSRVVGEQSTLTSLAFALDTMTREIRTGTHYYCGTVNQVRNVASAANADTAVLNCTASSSGISFREGGESITNGASDKRIAYYFQNGMLYRQVGVGQPEQIINNDLVITEGRFVSTGAAPLGTGNNRVQPTVTVLVVARDRLDPSGKLFTLQTTVTQRELDL